jgi:hypothetical protein
MNLYYVEKTFTSSIKKPAVEGVGTDRETPPSSHQHPIYIS